MDGGFTMEGYGSRSFSILLLSIELCITVCLERVMPHFIICNSE